ncbi:MAG: GTP cyclohydrolase II [Rhodobacteraceae bacterium]|nr:GTP cyclohydrolase II [Paracoccaceae bacterium]
MQSVPLALEHFRRGGIVLVFDRAGQPHLALSAELARLPEVALMKSSGSDAFSLALTASELFQLAANAHLPKCEAISAREGGLLEYEGLSEAAIDLARLSGLKLQVLLRALEPQDVSALAERHQIPAVTTGTLIQYRQRNEAAVVFVAVADLPTPHAAQPFRAHSFRSSIGDVEHLALVSPGEEVGDPLVRIHSECLTGDAFGSLRCDCGPQLDESLRRLGASPGGILVYMRGHEGRGIGLANKMRAYALQDKGLDTVEANTALGLPEDARDFGQAAQILRALGHDRVRLLTNNPEKATGLERHGISVSKVEPLVIPPNPFNAHYLDTKATKFGHFLPQRSAT